MNSGSCHTLASDAAPKRFSNSPVSLFTVSVTASGLPASSSARGCDHATSKIFSWVAPDASIHPLTTWMRSRSAPRGSLKALIRSCTPALLSTLAGSTAPMPTVLAGSPLQCAATCRVIRGPVVAYTARRWNASRIASRVFSFAHTAASPEADRSQPVALPSPSAFRRLLRGMESQLSLP